VTHEGRSSKQVYIPWVLHEKAINRLILPKTSKERRDSRELKCFRTQGTLRTPRQGDDMSVPQCRVAAEYTVDKRRFETES
jgi:hypothetical protein